MFLAPLGDSLHHGRAVEAGFGIFDPFLRFYPGGLRDGHEVRVHAETGVSDQVEPLGTCTGKFSQPFPRVDHVDIKALVLVLLYHLWNELRFRHHDRPFCPDDVLHRLRHPGFPCAGIGPYADPFPPRRKRLHDRLHRLPLGGFQPDLLQFGGQVLFIPADFVKGLVHGGEFAQEYGGQLGIELDIVKTQFTGRFHFARLVHKEGFYRRFVEDGRRLGAVIVVIFERFRLFDEHVLSQVIDVVYGDALDVG